MPIDTYAQFYLDKHSYELNEKVPVYLQEKEVVGYATVVEIEPTAWVDTNGKRNPMDGIKFKFDEETKVKYSTYEPYYAGMTSKLCIYDIVAQREREKQREKERINKLKQQPLNNKLLCNKCDSLVAASKKPRSNKCPVCRKGTLMFV